MRRNNLEKIKLKDFEEVTSFFDEFKKASNELKSAGGTITEEEKLRYMLRVLPSSYSHIGDLVDVIPEKERTVEYLMSKIKLKSIEEKDNRAPQASSVFSTDMCGKCYSCGEAGHMQASCPRGAAQNGRGRGSFRNRGSSRGNYQRGNGRSFQRGGGHGGNYARGRSRGRGAANSSLLSHQERSNEHNVPSNAFITEVNESQVKSDLRLDYENSINWIIDSGCTDLIINVDNVFDEYVELKQPVDVKLGDGHVLKATKVGKVNVIFQVYGSDVRVTLCNVFLCQRYEKESY